MILVVSTGPSSFGTGTTQGGAVAPMAAAAAVSIGAPEFTFSSSTAHSGDTVEGSLKVVATGGTASGVTVRLTANPSRVVVEPECVPNGEGACALGEVGAAGKSVPIKVKIPTTMRSGTVTIDAAVESSNAEAVTANSPQISVQPAALALTVGPSDGKVTAGKTATTTVTVKATSGTAGETSVTIGAEPELEYFVDSCAVEGHTCQYASVDDAGDVIKVSLRVPSSWGGKTFRVKASAKPSNGDTATASRTFKVAKASSGGGGGGSDGGSGGGSSGGSGGGSSGGSGGGSGGSSGSGIGSGSTGGINPGLGSAPAGSSGSPLPNVAGQQPVFPDVAPPAAGGGAGAVPAGRSARLLPDGTAAQEMTLDRLAASQAAWLAALLVAFILLLTYARLGRIRLARAMALSAGQPQAQPGPGDDPGSAAAAASTPRGEDPESAAGPATRGAHRRPRRWFRRAKTV
jgi:hypothetical protein